jgi:dTMP kinase
MFITLEGTEASGKSTHLRLLADELSRLSYPVFTTREPGGSPVGDQIRNILLHGEALDATAELMLFLADRAQHVSQVIRPHLENGDIVLCDRYADSTVCYQGYGRGLDIEFLRSLNRFVTKDLLPDLTLVFDLPIEIALTRRKREEGDRIDCEEVSFHQRVREGFLKEVAMEPERFRVIDASTSIEAVFKDVLAIVLPILER